MHGGTIQMAPSKWTRPFHQPKSDQMMYKSNKSTNNTHTAQHDNLFVLESQHSLKQLQRHRRHRPTMKPSHSASVSMGSGISFFFPNVSSHQASYCLLSIC